MLRVIWRCYRGRPGEAVKYVPKEWQIDGETVETVADFIFLGSKITTDGDCSHEIKRCLPLGWKVMTNLDSILKAETLLCQQRSV